MRPLAPLVLGALLLASPVLAQSDPQPGSIVVTPPGFELPAGGSCSGDIARYRAIQSNDLASGNVNVSVYNKIKVEIAAAERECAAGRDAQARAMIYASKKRHGYPTDL